MDELYQKNITSINNYYPELATILSAQYKPVISKFEIINTPSGSRKLSFCSDNSETIILNENEISPEKSALQKVIKYNFGFGGITYVLGFGTGHIISAIRGIMAKSHRIVVFEADSLMIGGACLLNNLYDIFNDSRIEIRCGNNCTFNTNEIDNITLLYRDINVIRSETYDYYPIYKKFEYTITDYVDQNQMNIKAKIRFGPIKTVNLIHNLHYLKQSAPLTLLDDKFKNFPAVCVAAGPSLKKNIEYLKEIKGKALIIAVCSVAQVLENHGITPDIITTLDSQPTNAAKFINFKTDPENVFLAYLPTANSSIIAKFPKRFVCLLQDHQSFWFSDYIYGDEKKLEMSATTVAHLSFNVAHKLGCDPIIFIGQDLSFPNDEDHIDGVAIRSSKDWVQTHGDMFTDGIDGKPVRTYLPFIQMKEIFEKYIASENLNVINATEGGANIKGTKILSLKETIDRYCTIRRDDIYNILLNANKQGIEILDKAISNKKINENIDYITEIKNITTPGLNVLKYLLKNDDIAKIKQAQDYENKLNNMINPAHTLLYESFLPVHLMLEEAHAIKNDFDFKDWLNIELNVFSELDAILTDALNEFKDLKKRMNSSFDEKNFNKMTPEKKMTFIKFLTRINYIEEAFLKLDILDNSFSEFKKEILGHENVILFLDKISRNHQIFTNMQKDRMDKIRGVDESTYFTTVSILIENNRVEDAQIITNHLIEKYAKNINSWLYSARVENLLKNYDVSNSRCFEALKIRPNCADVYVQLIDNFISLNNKEEAKKNFNILKEIYPDSSEIPV